MPLLSKHSSTSHVKFLIYIVIIIIIVIVIIITIDWECSMNNSRSVTRFTKNI